MKSSRGNEGKRKCLITEPVEVPLSTPQEGSSGATSEIIDVEGITLEVPTLPEEETNEIGAPEVRRTNTGAELPPGDRPPTTMLPAEATIYRLETVRDADSSDADDWPDVAESGRRHTLKVRS